MPGVKTARRTINRLPARRPFAAIAIEWRGVESQPGYDGERMTLARINRDPFAGAALAVAAKLCRTDRRADQTSRAQHVGDCAGTIVTMILK